MNLNYCFKGLSTKSHLMDDQESLVHNTHVTVLKSKSDVIVPTRSDSTAPVAAKSSSTSQISQSTSSVSLPELNNSVRF